MTRAGDQLLAFRAGFRHDAPARGVSARSRDARDAVACRYGRVVRGVHGDRGGGVGMSSPEISEPMPMEKSRVGRRTFMKGLGVAGAGAIGLSGRGRFGAVGSAEAVAPLFVAGAIGAGIAARWALDEVNALVADSPAEGLTADALKQQVYQAVLTRESTNASTFVDNRNLTDGLEHTAYTDAKIAAIEQLNAGVSESDVLSAATDAVDSYLSTVQSNLIKTWNESVQELYQLESALDDHPDTAVSDAIDPRGAIDGSSLDHLIAKTDRTYTSFAGTTETVQVLNGSLSNDTHVVEFDPVNGNTETADVSDLRIAALNPDGGDVEYLFLSEWLDIHAQIQTTYDDVSTGISTWVTNVYGSVQSGEIEISELVTPRERAAMMSEDEGLSQALADLIALNIPVDLEREATIHIAETGTTLRGSFALTNEADGPIESGATYDPATFAGDVYFTTDISLLEGTWSAFETGVDGGTITLTSEPYEGMVYSVETTAGETVSVPASDWVDSGTGTWTYDASASLETPITEVASVEYFAETDETQFETIGLDSPFTVERLENTNTGEEETSASFSSTEPQDDTNYITQDEWDSLEQQNQELIEKYEESQNTGGFGFGDFDIGPIPGGGVAVGALALGAYLLGR